MRLTTKGRFAVTAMLDLAIAGRKEPGDACRHQPAAEHLALVPGAAFREVAAPHAGRQHSRPGGGYTLARSLERVSVADIIAAVDEPLDATQCGGKENCHDEQRCMTHDLWAKLNDKMYEYLDSVKLSDLVAQQATRKSAVSVLQDKRGKEAGGIGLNGTRAK